MTLAYRIVNWKQQFEVTSDHGKAAKVDTPLEGLRKSAIPYLRKRVTGHSLSPTYRKLIKMAWEEGILMEMACLGIYDRFLNLAGAQDDPKYRGWILDEKQRPIKVPQIAELLDIRDDGTFDKLVKILCHEEINWVELAEFPYTPRPVGVNGGERGWAEGERVEPFKNETETEEEENLNYETERDSPGVPDQGGRSASPPPPSALVTDTVSEISASASVSAPRGGEEIKKRRYRASVRLCEIIRPRNSSDRTTFRDIFDQLEQRMIYVTEEPLFGKALEKAEQCCQIDGDPIKIFVAAMKKSPFCYIPVRRGIIRGSTDEYRKR